MGSLLNTAMGRMSAKSMKRNYFEVSTESTKEREAWEGD